MKKNEFLMFMPYTFADESVNLKFCFLALRNMIYYVKKGLMTYTKNNKKTHDATVKQFIDNYVECCKNSKILSEDEITKLLDAFKTKSNVTINKKDYILNTEKILGFNLFSFYCNCIVELSFHIDRDYFCDDYIKTTIQELCQKTLVSVNDNFIEFVVADVNELLEQLKS